VEVKVGFPDCGESETFRKLRKFALKYNLIPQTMWAKEKIKLMLYGKLDPIPAEATEETGNVHLLLDIKENKVIDSHKVLYVIGKKH
jgi:hypothetical protein